MLTADYFCAREHVNCTYIIVSLLACRWIFAAVRFAGRCLTLCVGVCAYLPIHRYSPAAYYGSKILIDILLLRVIPSCFFAAITHLMVQVRGIVLSPHVTLSLYEVMRELTDPTFV